MCRVQMSSSILIYFCHIVANVNATSKSSLCVGDYSPTVLFVLGNCVFFFCFSAFKSIDIFMRLLCVCIINEVSVAVCCLQQLVYLLFFKGSLDS